MSLHNPTFRNPNTFNFLNIWIFANNIFDCHFKFSTAVSVFTFEIHNITNLKFY